MSRSKATISWLFYSEAKIDNASKFNWADPESRAPCTILKRNQPILGCLPDLGGVPLLLAYWPLLLGLSRYSDQRAGFVDSRAQASLANIT